MAELPENYSDVFWITMTPYTALFDFGVRLSPQREQQQVAPTEGQETDQHKSRIVTRIRMSPEHAKVLAFVLRRHIQDFERQTGVTIQVPLPILNELRIALEDWQQFAT